MPKITNLSAGEEVLFSKYNGQTDLHLKDDFWNDVEKHLFDYNVVLPMEYLPENIRILQDMLECKPGTCGECCRYGITPIYQYDVHRMLKVKTLDELQSCVYTRKDGSMYMRGEPVGTSCPLLKDEVCTIYGVRPDVCWLFPIQKGAHMVGNKGLIRYRLRCKPAVEVARKIFSGALKGGKHILLPNLTLINMEV